MPPLMGQAALQVALQPGSANKELERMEAAIRRLEEMRVKQEKELTDLEKQAGGQLADVRQSADRAARNRPGFADKIKGLVDTVMGPATAAANVVEWGIPKLGQLAEQAGKGTFMEGPMQQMNAQLQKLADEVTSLRSQLEAVRPVVGRTLEFNLAALRLGGKLPDDQDVLIQQLWKIESAQQDMQRNLQRDIDNQTIDLIFQAAREASRGGK